MGTRQGILLTGATGFIGHHLAQRAIEKGYRVHALVRPSSRLDELRALGVTFHYADITEYESVKEIFAQLVALKAGIDYVIHAAGLTKARTEAEFLLANCGGTQNIISAMEHAGLSVKKIIFISSLAACGPQLKGKVIDKNLSKPVTLYGKSKLLAEAVVKRGTLPYLILRPTAVYGPGEKDLLTVFKTVNRRVNPVLGYHEQELTFIYVKDLVEIVLAAVISHEMNKTYFVTDGMVYRKKAFGQAIARALNKNSLSLWIPLPLVKTIAFASQLAALLTKKPSALNLEKYKELTAPSWNCDASETFKALAFAPQYSLQAGVSETAAWYREHKWI